MYWHIEARVVLDLLELPDAVRAPVVLSVALYNSSVDLRV